MFVSSINLTGWKTKYRKKYGKARTKKKINIWSWVSSSDQIKAKYKSHRGQKPVTLREDLINIEIGKYFRNQRNKTGFSAEKVGEFMGFSQAQVTYYENGNDSFRIGTILEFCELYEISTNIIFDIISVNHNNPNFN